MLLRAALASCLLLGLGAAAPAAACDPAPTRVTAAYAGPPDPAWRPPPPTAPPPAVGLGDTLTVVATDLPKLFAEAACRGGASRVVLFLDGRPVPDVAPDPPSDPDGPVVSFGLHRTAAARAFWVGVLGGPTEESRPVAVSLGLADRFAVPSDARVAFTLVPVRRFLFWLGVLAAAALLFVLLAARSDMLRDPTARPRADERRAFSAARVQAAWWFFVVLGCYLFVGVVTGDFFGTLGGGALALLGLSAGTAAGSAAIDGAKDTPQARAEAAVVVQGAAARAAAAAAAPAAGAPAPAAVEVEAFGAAARRARGASTGFLLDVLSDANGVTFHRFQLLVWSVVLAAVFAWSTWRDLALPPLDTGLLGAYALSAATFLGLKLPEPVVPAAPAP